MRRDRATFFHGFSGGKERVSGEPDPLRGSPQFEEFAVSGHAGWRPAGRGRGGGNCLQAGLSLVWWLDTVSAEMQKIQQNRRSRISFRDD